MLTIVCFCTCFRLILEDAQSEIVYSALSCLDISRCASQLEKFLEGIEGTFTCILHA